MFFEVIYREKVVVSKAIGETRVRIPLGSLPASAKHIRTKFDCPAACTRLGNKARSAHLAGPAQRDNPVRVATDQIAPGSGRRSSTTGALIAACYAERLDLRFVNNFRFQDMLTDPYPPPIPLDVRSRRYICDSSPQRSRSLGESSERWRRISV